MFQTVKNILESRKLFKNDYKVLKNVLKYLKLSNNVNVKQITKT